MKLQPLHDWVLIRTGEPSGKSPGGIIIPDSAQEKSAEGEVLAVGLVLCRGQGFQGEAQEEDICEDHPQAGRAYSL